MTRSATSRSLVAKWRPVTILLALSIAAAACGSTETSTRPTLAPQAVDTPAAEESGSVADDAPADSNSTSGDESISQADIGGEVATPAVNLFPDIDVLDIADGTTVNLAAELGGADKATLLWFFAPH